MAEVYGTYTTHDLNKLPQEADFEEPVAKKKMGRPFGSRNKPKEAKSEQVEVRILTGEHVKENKELTMAGLAPKYIRVR